MEVQRHGLKRVRGLECLLHFFPIVRYNRRPEVNLENWPGHTHARFTDRHRETTTAVSRATSHKHHKPPPLLLTTCVLSLYCLTLLFVTLTKLLVTFCYFLTLFFVFLIRLFCSKVTLLFRVYKSLVNFLI